MNANRLPRCVYAGCTRTTPRIFMISGVDGSWPVCGQHGHQMFKALSSLHPGHGLYTRRVTS